MKVSMDKNNYLVYFQAHARPQIIPDTVYLRPMNGNVLDCYSNHVFHRLVANIKRGRLDGYKDNIDVKSREPRPGIEWGDWLYQGLFLHRWKGVWMGKDTPERHGRQTRVATQKCDGISDHAPKTSLITALSIFVRQIWWVCVEWRILSRRRACLFIPSPLFFFFFFHVCTLRRWAEIAGPGATISNHLFEVPAYKSLVTLASRISLFRSVIVNIVNVFLHVD